jgi:hypothetical protein
MRIAMVHLGQISEDFRGIGVNFQVIVADLVNQRPGFGF